MNPAVVTAVLFVCLPCVGASLEWGGSYENTPGGFYLDDQAYLLDGNRLRLDVNVSLGDHVRFEGNLIFRKCFGATSFPSTVFLPSRMAILLPEGDVEFLGDTIYLDNAALTLQTGRTLFTAGIQQLPWGCGYAWNPTDIWNAKDLLDPTYEKPGSPALKIEQGVGPFSFCGVAGFHRDYRHVPWAASAGGNVSGFDIGVMGAARTREFSNPVLGPDTWFFRRTLAGYWLSGQIAEIGLWSEGAWNRQETDPGFVQAYRDSVEPRLPALEYVGLAEALATDYAKERSFVQLLAGMDHTIGIGNGLYLMAEYFYDGEGNETSPEYSLEDWMEYMEGEALGLGRHSLFCGVRYPPTDLTDLSLYVAGNLSDGSILFNPWFTLSITDDCTLDLTAAIPVGGDNDQFRNRQLSASARLKVFW